MDDSSTATTPSPAAATAAGYDAARDKTTTTTAGSRAAGSNAGSGSGVSSIRLLIKSSNQQYDDMNIESDLCWTVERLKKQLSMVYPGKPEIKDQKLIYSGKLVNDTQKLSEVIRSYKDVYQQHHIFHLVCVNRSLTKPPYKAMTTPAKDNGVNANTNTNATANANVNATPRLETNNTNDNELRQRHVSTTAAAAAAQIPYQQLQQQPQQQQQQQQYPWMQHLTDPNMQNHAYHLAAYQAAAAAAYGAVNVSTMTHLTQEQQQALLTNAWIQHCYAQYMQQVMQRPSGAQNAGPALPMLHPLLQNMPVIPHMMSVPQADPAAVPAAAQAANEAAAAGLQPAAAAAAGRQVDGPNFVNIQEEPEMRDWLDSFFSFTRLAIFATVLYFNSSPMRCLLVLLIASGIYLYHIGILRRRRERNNNNINRNNNAGNDAAAFAAVQQIQRMMDAAVERDNNPQAAAEPAPVAPAGQDADEAVAARPAAASAAGGADQADAAEAAAVAAAVVEPANANNSVISIVRTFVITFFTSLLPEAPAL